MLSAEMKILGNFGGLGVDHGFALRFDYSS